MRRPRGGNAGRRAQFVVAADRREYRRCLRREVEHRHIGWRQLAGRVNARARFDLAAQVGQQRCDCVGDRLRTAGRDRPPVTMPRGEDAQPDRRGHRIVQRPKGMRRKDHPDLGGHQSDSARGHGAGIAGVTPRARAGPRAHCVELLERLRPEPRMLVVIGRPMSIDRVVSGENRRYRVITAMGAKSPG
jgi:hypothetical protein